MLGSISFLINFLNLKVRANILESARLLYLSGTIDEKTLAGGCFSPYPV